MKSNGNQLSLFISLIIITFLFQYCEKKDLTVQDEIQNSIDLNSKTIKDKNKIDVCHRDENTGSWSIKSISINSISVHLKHGDIIIDEDGDGFAAFNECGFLNADGIDCDDTDSSINPSVTEICDGVDNNCNGSIDEGVKSTFYMDADNDGFGDNDNSIQACLIPVGYSSDNTDCDDSKAGVNPGAEEICYNGIDDNCDGQIDEDCAILGPYDVYNPATGRIWMDRNLGASQVATSSTDEASFGDLYQWGRGTDGHQLRTSLTTSTKSSTDEPGHGNFIVEPTFPGDWRVTKNDNLWQGVNGINNPCPKGYRLPTEDEWLAELLSWISRDSEGAFSSPLKLPTTGFRFSDNGSLRSVGINAGYWSSTSSSTQSSLFHFDSNIAALTTNRRAYGFSCRCIKD